ncbi:hypothetical protein CEXT_792601 [Caerostris extrusa]|uniref:Ycf15 n=1 Tax=Caerostris extrusa TaxID=172846 RepID=A0AAV4R841_CAEEX|nr:hypothetical protein CEXT_792601 [Caerostris extrusa]
MFQLLLPNCSENVRSNTKVGIKKDKKEEKKRTFPVFSWKTRNAQLIGCSLFQCAGHVRRNGQSERKRAIPFLRIFRFGDHHLLFSDSLNELGIKG